MAAISPMNSTSTTKASSSYGLSGLVSGMDTEKMVEDMLKGTQLKIDASNQKKQQLVWKQGMYRDVITSLQAFQTKFFSFTNEKSNFLSNSFYNTMSSVPSSSKIGASASSSAAAGTMVVNSVSQLATQTKIKAGDTALSPLQGIYSQDKLNSLFDARVLKITVGSTTEELVIKGTTEQSILAGLETQLNDKFAGAVTASVADGVLSIKSTDPEQAVTINSDSNSTALAILGLTAGASAAGEVKGKIDAAQAATSLTVTLDGVQKNIELNWQAADATEFADSLQTAVTKAFGSSIKVGTHLVGSDNVLTFTPMKTEYDASGNPTGNLIEDKTRQITLTGSDAVMDVFGMKNGQSNKITVGMELGNINFAETLTGTVDGDTTTYEFKINGTNFSFTSKDTLRSVLSKINASDAGVNITYSSLEDKFEIRSKEYGAGHTIEMVDGPDSNFLSALFGTSYQLTEGQNAILSVNGIEMQRSSNNFTVDGVTLTLKETFNTETSIEISRGTDQIITGIKDFVTEYNKLLDELNKLINVKATYKDYPPLTSAQKAEMSEKEIELWEEKAKEGLLRNDPTISKLLNNMRSALYQRVEGSNFALYDLGIDTSSDYKEYGKLVIKDEAALRKALDLDPDSVQKLFADVENGIAAQFNNLINKSAKVSYSSPGSLVSLAGTAGMVNHNSTLAKEIKFQEDKLDRLQELYETEKARYWKQFNDMEKLISQMNQQSTWLASQFV